MRGDPVLRRIINECGLVSADGQAVVWASRLVGDPLPARVAGIDLMNELFGLAEKRAWRVYILGARQDVLEQAVIEIVRRHPALQIAGYRNGWFADAESEGVAAEIRSVDPDILFVGMSSPRKEYWLGCYGPTLGVPLVMGVGGAIDVVAGVTSRAPRWMQVVGLEWLYRLLQEPRRLGPRYLRTNGRFVALALRGAIRRRSGSPTRPQTPDSVPASIRQSRELALTAARDREAGT